MEEKRRIIKLEPIEVKYTSGNDIPFSCVPKRKATEEEAIYALQEILGFDLNLSFEDVDWDKDEVKALKKEFTDALNGFLNGGDYGVLCENCYCCDEDLEMGNFASFLWLVSYCQEKGIL